MSSPRIDRVIHLFLLVFRGFDYSYPPGQYGQFPTWHHWSDPNLRRLIDKPPVVEEDENGHSIWWAIRTSLASLNPRERHIILLRHGLGSGVRLTLEQIGLQYHVTRDRIRQIEMQGYRKLRHPSRSSVLRKFFYRYTRSDGAAYLARVELFETLMPQIGHVPALNIAARVQRKYLAESLRVAKSADLTAVGRLAAASCRVAGPGTCPLCGEPSLPGIQWCLRHMIPARNRIVLVCDGCGVMFLRRPHDMVSYSRDHGRTQYAVFHSKDCFINNGTRLGVYQRRSEARIHSGLAGQQIYV